MADNPMTHPSPEAVERAMKCVETLERSFSSEDMTRGEQSAITLRAHVTALTDQLAVEQKRRQDIDFAFVTCANDKAALTAQLEAERSERAADKSFYAQATFKVQDYARDLEARLSAETARADAAEAEAKALREAWADHATDIRSAKEEIWFNPDRAETMLHTILDQIDIRATLAQPADDGGKT